MTEDANFLTPDEGRVAAILTERELAINIGAKAGVVIGMKYKVVAETPTEIIDPLSGKPLGSIEREKVRVEVIEVNELYSICRTFRKKVIGGWGLASASSIFSQPTEVVETLKAEDASYLPPLPEEESYVKKGDRLLRITSN